MAAQLGKELLLKIHDGTSYQLIGGFKSNDFTINGEKVEITSKDSAGFKEYLESAGLRSVSASGNGVFMNDAAFAVAHSHMLAGTHPECQVIIPGFGTYTGKFTIDSLKLSGGHQGEVTYDITFESSGPVAFV